MIKKVFLSLFLVMFSFGGTFIVSAEEIIQETIVSEEVVISESEQETVVSEETENQDLGFSQEEQRRPGDEGQDDEERVTICHANNGQNEYSVITVPASAVDGEGNNDHSSHEGDIIPITDRNEDGDITVADCTFDGDSDDEDPIDEEEENESRIVTIVADMIVCDSENLLPNWGNGYFDITSTTAQDFVLESGEECRFKSGRLFQWGDDLVSFPGDTFLGEALGWFTTDPTDTNGRVEFTVDLNDLESSNQIEMRQVLEEGDLAFTYTANGNNEDSISAEFYCHNDVLNYDNWDWINNPQADSTYYCVGFNVEEKIVIEEPQFCPVGNLIENGSFENPILESEWSLFSSEETGWDIAWTGDYEGQPEEALLEIQSNLSVTAQDGNQYVELDTDWGFGNGEPAGVAIGQSIETIEGKEYTVSFYTHARPDTNESENSLDFSIQQGKETTQTHSIVGTNEWVRHEYSFIAQYEYTYIQFEYTGVENTYGMFLDNVSVTCGDVILDDGGDDEEGDEEEENPGDEDPIDGEEENPSDENNQSTSTTGSFASSRGSVLGAFSSGEVLGASDDATCPAFTQFHKRGDIGGDVKMIQQFLNDHMQAGLVVDGVYGPATEKAVHAFQQKYWEQTIKPWTPELSGDTTGRWYKTTRAWANELLDCREVSQVLEDTGRTYSTEMFVKEEETTETNTVN